MFTSRFLEMARRSTSRKPTILCVDDNENILVLLSDFLGSKGVRVIATSDIAFAVLAYMVEPVDLVVVDNDMPEVDGVELSEQLRSIDKEIPVVMFSGSLLPPAERRELISRFVPKGQGCEELWRAIKAGFDFRATGTLAVST